MFKQVIDSFQKGFSLANKSWGLFLFWFIFSTISGIPNLLGDSFIKVTLQIVGFLLVFFIGSGFSFSLPIFLVEKQQGKTLKLGNILSTTLRSTKRLILFTILTILFLILTLILSSLLIFTAQFIYEGNLNFLENSTLGFELITSITMVLFIGLYSFLTFASIYFSLEKQSVFSSVKKSISLSFKNLNFIVILFVINVFTFFVLVLFLNNYQNPYQLFIMNIIYAYELLLLTAASLIFYQNLAGTGKSDHQEK